MKTKKEKEKKRNRTNSLHCLRQYYQVMAYTNSRWSDKQHSIGIISLFNWRKLNVCMCLSVLRVEQKCVRKINSVFLWSPRSSCLIRAQQPLEFIGSTIRYLKVHHIWNWRKNCIFWVFFNCEKKPNEKSSETINWMSVAPNNFGIFCLDRKANEMIIKQTHSAQHRTARHRTAQSNQTSWNRRASVVYSRFYSMQ